MQKTINFHTTNQQKTFFDEFLLSFIKNHISFHVFGAFVGGVLAPKAMQISLDTI